MSSFKFVDRISFRTYCPAEGQQKTNVLEARALSTKMTNEKSKVGPTKKSDDDKNENCLPRENGEIQIESQRATYYLLLATLFVSIENCWLGLFHNV